MTHWMKKQNPNQKYSSFTLMVQSQTIRNDMSLIEQLDIERRTYSHPRSLHTFWVHTVFKRNPKLARSSFAVSIPRGFLKKWPEWRYEDRLYLKIDEETKMLSISRAGKSQHSTAVIHAGKGKKASIQLVIPKKLVKTLGWKMRDRVIMRPNTFDDVTYLDVQKTSDVKRAIRQASSRLQIKKGRAMIKLLKNHRIIAGTQVLREVNVVTKK